MTEATEADLLWHRRSVVTGECERKAGRSGRKVIGERECSCFDFAAIDLETSVRDSETIKTRTKQNRRCWSSQLSSESWLHSSIIQMNLLEDPNPSRNASVFKIFAKKFVKLGCIRLPIVHSHSPFTAFIGKYRLPPPMRQREGSAHCVCLRDWVVGEEMRKGEKRRVFDREIGKCQWESGGKWG